MMKPLFFMGYTPAPDQVSLSVHTTANAYLACVRVII